MDLNLAHQVERRREPDEWNDKGSLKKYDDDKVGTETNRSA